MFINGDILYANFGCFLFRCDWEILRYSKVELMHFELSNILVLCADQIISWKRFDHDSDYQRWRTNSICNGDGWEFWEINFHRIFAWVAIRILSFDRLAFIYVKWNIESLSKGIGLRIVDARTDYFKTSRTIQRVLFQTRKLFLEFLELKKIRTKTKNTKANSDRSITRRVKEVTIASCTNCSKIICSSCTCNDHN